MRMCSMAVLVVQLELGALIRTRINRIRPLTKVSKRTEERDFALSFFEFFKTEACMLRPQRAALPSALLASGFTLHLPRLLWLSAAWAFIICSAFFLLAGAK